MNYTHSTLIPLIPLSSYSTDGLCDGIPLRVHKHQILEDLGCIRAQERLAQVRSPNRYRQRSSRPPIQHRLDHVPETKPERFEALSYFNEFVGLHDDVVEEVQQSLGDEQNDEARNICLDTAAGVLRKHNKGIRDGRR
ncbi:hypothetical protein B0T21DRAFT_116395 [Apiosordaria backusii]|uniref:Uncharacterized protein n=1 Tax=Apiosordaria backusii TaxID=314023 RepID=A0AA40ELM1_9PEZI|nr:hypothetical protein B0T21DRAFT_116395 [Apiosordaria backusii]